jgi:hypothetical protein
MPPMEPVDPVFDEEQAVWAEGDALVADPAQTRTHPPVSDRYMQDVQSGFARPVPPEQLYAAPVQANRQPEPQAFWQPLQQSSAPADAQPVHPGLDADVLRQNMGLGWEYPAEEAIFDDYNREEAAPGSPSFTPFTQKTSGSADNGKKSRNPFMNLMRLVGDESTRPSIKDLQSTVDVRTAFHEPVFPKHTFPEEDE